MPVRAASLSTAEMRSALVMAGADGGMRVRFVRNGDDAAEPFVIVHRGRFARILLAETVLPDGATGQRFALKLRVDDVGGDSPPANADLDRQWQQERRELARVRSPHVVAPVPVPESLLRSPPVFHCRRVDRYFHPVCPETGAPLVVCRDDAQLARAGLPGYANDHVRYLHAADRAATRFYQVGDGAGSAGSGSAGSAMVRNQRDLVRAWRAPLLAEQSLELPCQNCEHRAECYPPGDGAVLPAERQLHAVSFYDVDALALELAAMSFEEAVVRLGDGAGGSGGNGAGAAERLWSGGGSVLQRTLEVLRLKLAAFVDVCRGVAAVHESGRPHLGVSPQNIVVYEARAGSAVAANWRLRFAVTDLGGAIPVVVPGSDETLWQPGREVSEDETSRLFLSPALRSLEGGTVTMSVRCSEVAGADGDRLVVEVHRAGVPPFVLPGDFVLVQPVAGGPSRGARIDEVGARGLFATVARDQPSPATSMLGTQVMKRPVMPGASMAAGGAPVGTVAWAGTTFDARLHFARRSGPSADLYGLGMLLLRLLLVHDEQSLAEVAATAEHCLQRMTVAAQHAGENADLAAQWQHILDGDDGEGRFGTWHLMHHRVARQAVFDAELQGTSVVPRSVWRALMALAGRLLLAPPVARANEGRAPARPLDGVLAELASIEQLLDVELFGRHLRDPLLATICTQRMVALRGELAAEDIDEAEPGASRGFVLAVGRVGESGIEQHHFVQDRITIGRRDGENMLVLGDPMVSSKHAVIELDGGEYVLFDRGSTNGTEVDGIRLPVEVPHPLDDGSVIHIRPFVLSFRRSSAVAMQTVNTPVSSADDLFERVCSVYAASAVGGDGAAATAVGEVLDHARSVQGRRGLLAQLEQLGRRLPVSPEARPAPGAEPGAALSAQALRSLQQLARNLLLGGELTTVAALQEFAGRLLRFVEVTSHWIESMLDWRSVLGQQLDMRSTQTGTGRSTLRSAREIQESLLRPTGDDTAAIAEHFLERFLDDVLAILEGLLLGNLRARNVVREQLDPARLVEAAGQEAKLRILVQATAGSALWKLFEQTWRSITAPDQREAELQRLLQVATDRRARDRDG